MVAYLGCSMIKRTTNQEGDYRDIIAQTYQVGRGGLRGLLNLQRAFTCQRFGDWDSQWRGSVVLGDGISHVLALTDANVAGAGQKALLRLGELVSSNYRECVLRGVASL